MAGRFCVVTTGRTGSNSLFAALRQHADIATPCLASGRAHPELLHPDVLEDYRRELAARVGRALPAHDDVAEGFYAAHAGSAYAGFKLMPWQHPGFARFVQRADVRFIVLRRLDMVSTVASFFVARRFGTWTRGSREVVANWTFGRDHVAAVRRHVRFLLNNEYRLSRIRDAIALTYEDLCQPDFRSAPLEAFFGRGIGIEKASPPTHASTYITNWDEFRSFVESERDRILAAPRVDATGARGPATP